MSARVRFAPSPTGFLHVGGARTALYNWLFARHHKGTFILRIEDTDEARSTEESMTAILTGLHWLGLTWDEGPGAEGAEGSKGNVGPYFQMMRTDIYRQHLDILVKTGKAYPCFCSKETLDQMRTKAMLMKRPPKYDGRCRKISADESEKRIKAGEPHVYRFARPHEGSVEFTDVVKGPVKFESELLDDFVILKSSGIPTFMFAGAIDDHLMKITHVIRGDDHLSNTPRQIQIYQAFGWNDIPIYAHISMIHGPDGARLSKRHGATSIEEFKKEGYLPEVMLNYLALLGWATSDSQQLFDPINHFEELVTKFELERCQKSPAVFDMEKLKWMNGVYIRKFSAAELTARAWPYLLEAGVVTETSPEKTRALVGRSLLLEQEKLVVLSDAPRLIDFFLKDEVVFDPEAVQKVLKKPEAPEVLKGIIQEFEKASDFSAAGTEKICRDYAASHAFKNGQVFHPVRVAVSGRTQGPSLFHMLEVLEKPLVMARITKAIEVASHVIA